MGVKEARSTFNRVAASLIVVFSATLLLSFFFRASPAGQTQSYTGHFLLNPTTFLVALVNAMLVAGIVILRSGICKIIAVRIEYLSLN